MRSSGKPWACSSSTTCCLIPSSGPLKLVLVRERGELRVDLLVALVLREPALVDHPLQDVLPALLGPLGVLARLVAGGLRMLLASTAAWATVRLEAFAADPKYAFDAAWIP